MDKWIAILVVVQVGLSVALGSVKTSDEKKPGTVGVMATSQGD
jgi:hypothetical protein